MAPELLRRNNTSVLTRRPALDTEELPLSRSKAATHPTVGFYRQAAGVCIDKPRGAPYFLGSKQEDCIYKPKPVIFRLNHPSLLSDPLRLCFSLALAGLREARTKASCAFDNGTGFVQ